MNDIAHGQSLDRPTGLRRTDIVLLVLVCVLLMGWGAVCERPLSMHEARLPQLSREIVLGQSDWLLPLSGGRPWLERPPLPHWLTAGSMLLFGQTEVAWVARLPAALAGTSIVLLGAWMAGVWFGRGFGVLSGVVLATTYELYTYASLAEDDIYLAAVAVAAMALFVKAEKSGRKDASWLGGRGWAVVLFFLLLGLTNLAKGPLVGAVPLVATIGVYELWNRDGAALRRYLWPWGILLFIALTLAWPLYAMEHYPEVWDNWRYDYAGRADTGHDGSFEKPFWYYLSVLPMILAPWIWASVWGLFVTARRAWTVRGSPERLLWCWACVGLVVLSLPARKHHHYFLPVVVPWAILAAHGLVALRPLLFAGRGPDWLRRPLTGALLLGLPGAVALFFFRHKIAGPAFVPFLLGGTWIVCVWLFYAGCRRHSERLVMAAVVAGYIVAAGWIQACVVSRDQETVAQLQFLADVRAAVPAGELLTVSAQGTSLDFFRLQFYLPGKTVLLHNLSFLRSDRIASPRAYVVARRRDVAQLERLGNVEMVLQSQRTYREKSPEDRFALFRVHFAPDLVRYPAPYVDVLQAMERRPGPWCGDKPRP